MNDCIWAWIGVCEEVRNGACDKYLSANCEKGYEISQQYEKDVEEALKPLMEKWRGCFRERD